MRGANLSDSSGKHADDPLVCHCNHTLRVYLDDAVSHSHASALRNAATKQAANHAVLNAETQLVLGVGPLDANFDDWRARHHIELDSRLRTHCLHETRKYMVYVTCFVTRSRSAGKP